MEYIITIKGIESAPQGSKKHVGRGIMVETCKRLKSWRKEVSLRAKLIVDEIIVEPVEIEVVFWFKRPLKHYLPNGMVRQSAPVYITNKNKGDLDKHCRALLDSLTKSAFADDSQVVSLHAVKKYCETESQTGATIKIRSINL
ncbi:Holliday junction resolvase (Rus) [uncultured Mediterranean phage uvMED]|jgi:crossover junction endodeoxyribonuclease RusA|nr:Holliday junction resolvase (Rus) [uncultured Mediterranean phage uvMED]